MIVELLNTVLSLEWAPAGSYSSPGGSTVSIPFPLPSLILTYNDFSQQCTSEQPGQFCQQHIPTSALCLAYVNEVSIKISRFNNLMNIPGQNPY